MCLLCLLRVRKLTWNGCASYAVRETQLSSFSVMHGASFTAGCFAKDKIKSWAWPMVADPSRGEGVGRSDESSFRNEQGGFCAKFRVLWAPRGSLRVLG